MIRKIISGFLIATFLFCSVAVAKKEKTVLQVTIIQRQESQSQYTYVVPGYESVDCRTNYNNVACQDVNRPALIGNYTVSGATLSLLLPDGRVAVVNCDAKRKVWSPTGGFVNPGERSCRQPLVNNITAEFDGDKAKLSWTVSIDGKKMDSETYRIIGILYKENK